MPEAILDLAILIDYHLTRSLALILRCCQVPKREKLAKVVARQLVPAFATSTTEEMLYQPSTKLKRLSSPTLE